MPQRELTLQSESVLALGEWVIFHQSRWYRRKYILSLGYGSNPRTFCFLSNKNKFQKEVIQMKKILCLVMALLTCLVVFAGCSGNSSSQGSSSKESTGDKVKIGIIKIVEHTSLNTIEESIISQLNKLGYVNGENAEITAL